MPGWQEILLILVVIVLIFGAKRIPEIAKALGKASGEYKKAKNAMQEEIQDIEKENSEKQTAELKDAEKPSDPEKKV